jgi:uncharacterized protein YjeT (DUF2065 family)
MGATLAMAFGLMLVIEGIMPFVAPGQWREMLRKVSALADGQIRFFGLAMMAAGVAVLALAR